eukprot:2146428-Pyramimonas_sp.AAC.1
MVVELVVVVVDVVGWWLDGKGRKGAGVGPTTTLPRFPGERHNHQQWGVARCEYNCRWGSLWHHATCE